MFTVAMPLPYRLLNYVVDGRYLEYYFDDNDLTTADVVGRSLRFNKSLKKYKVVDIYPNKTLEYIYAGPSVTQLQLLYTTTIMGNKRTTTTYTNSLIHVLNYFGVDYRAPYRDKCISHILSDQQSNLKVSKFIDKYKDILKYTSSLSDGQFAIPEYYLNRLRKGDSPEDIFDVKNKRLVTPSVNINKLLKHTNTSISKSLHQHSITMSNKIPNKNMNYNFLDFSNSLMSLIKYVMTLDYSDITINYSGDKDELKITAFNVYTYNLITDLKVSSEIKSIFHELDHHGDYPMYITFVKTTNDEGYIEYHYPTGPVRTYFDITSLILSM